MAPRARQHRGPRGPATRGRTRDARAITGAGAQGAGGAEGDPLEPLYRLAITAGLRLGELLALRWPDVDLEQRTLSVVATLEHSHGHEPVVAAPKTSRSRRQVVLGGAIVDALRAHRQAQPGIGFVFTRGDGRPLSRSIVDKAWTRLNARADVPRVRFHDLRQTSATLLLGRGVHPKIVSEMLGHATVAITLDLYSHVTPTMQREAVVVMDDLLSQ
ncbi:MAG: site-specific integrase [Candidatus Dormibacter sp.]